MANDLSTTATLDPNSQAANPMNTAAAQDPYGLRSADAQVAAAAAGADIQVITPNSDIVQNRMVFSTVRGQARPSKTLTLRNTGNAALTFTLNLGDSQEKNNAVRLADHERATDFNIVNAPTGQTINLAPGATREISVAFLPKRVARLSTTPTTHTFNGENYASLTITSNDPDERVTTVNLAGLNTANYESDNEASVAEIVRSFGWGTDVGSENNRLSGAKTLIGDEVYSPYWVRADATKPVELFPIATFGSRGTIAHDGVFLRAKPSTGGRSQFMYGLPGSDQADGVPGSNVESGGENQKLLPKILVNGAGKIPTSSDVDFVPNSPFAIVRGEGWTDDNQNGPNKTHEFRIYTVRNADGEIVPNLWIAASDTGINKNKNFDYNDNIYLLRNARPENAALDPSRGALAPGSPDLILNFNKTYPGSLTDKDGQSLGFTNVQLNKNDGYTPTASYQRSLLDIDAAASRLRVTSTTGINSNDNNLVNGLETKFDSRLKPSVISTKLLGSLAYLDAGFEQAGLMFGPNDDNYIKLVARNNPTGGVGIEFLFENKGVGDRLGNIVALPNAASLQSLELKLFTDPEAGTIRAGYEAIDTAGNTTVVNLPNFINLNNKGSEYGHFFTAQGKAGILTSHKGGSQFTASFDQFAIKSNESTPPPTVIHRLDVGGTSYTDQFGRFWSTDNLAGFSPPLFTPTNAPAELGAGSQADIVNTTNDRLYRTYRARLPGVPETQNRVLTYNLPVGDTPGTYHVRLHFAEIFFGVPGGGPAGSGIGSRVFDINVENERKINNFDITAAAGDSMTAVVLPFENVQVNDGILNIKLDADINFGAISAIEVLKKA